MTQTPGDHADRTAADRDGVFVNERDEPAETPAELDAELEQFGFEPAVPVTGKEPVAADRNDRRTDVAPSQHGEARRIPPHGPHESSSPNAPAPDAGSVG